MLIRKATPDDVEAITSMGHALNVDRNSKKKSGLLEYKLTHDQYKRRIEDNPFSFVAEKDYIVGFSLAYDSKFIKRLIESDDRAASDDILKCVAKLCDGVAYWDQLCVSEEFQGKGPAVYLYYKTEYEMKNNSIKIVYAKVAHEPWKNEQSIKIITKRGWKLVNEFIERSGLTFGIYSKIL